MLNNQDAGISSDVLEYLAEESKRIDSYQKPLVRRPNLPSELVEHMCYWVSVAVRNYIVENFDVDIDSLDDQMSATVSKVVEGKDDESAVAAERLVDRRYDGGSVSAELALKSLHQCQVLIFKLSFAKMLGIRPVLARRIVYDPGGEALGGARSATGPTAGPASRPCRDGSPWLVTRAMMSRTLSTSCGPARSRRTLPYRIISEKPTSGARPGSMAAPPGTRAIRSANVSANASKKSLVG
ncbi:MAG: hypothetical protein CMM23_13620 [Rhodospirillaceae bacterium]|nr:hypothetical protein [Rhodospirillaceae bacterium]